MAPMRPAFGFCFLGLLLIAASLAGPPAPTAARISYAKEIKPFFEAKCGLCHGVRAAFGGLRLNTPEGIKKGGLHGPVIVPGKSKDSHMIRRMSGQGPKMPPTQTLAPKDISLVARWVDQGASFADPAPKPKPKPKAAGPGSL